MMLISKTTVTAQRDVSSI